MKNKHQLTSLAKETQTPPSTKTGTKVFWSFASLFALILALLCPLATLWALNTLFFLNIHYTFTNWVAIVVLIITLQAAIRIRNND